MTTNDLLDPTDPPLSREELIALVARTHQGSPYDESVRAGQSFAAQTKLPTRVAQNLGAGFGQWDFFPEPAAIVEFALAYVPPASEEDVWALARTWASDDADGKHTLMALVGRDILQHELRRIDVPRLRELFDEPKPTRARELRVALGLAAPMGAAAAAERKRPNAAGAPPKRTAAAGAPAAAAPRAGGDVPMRMPKPELRKPVKAEPPPPPKRFTHPKFGEGVLEAQDGAGPDAKLTIKFTVGSKTLLARYVTELC